MCVWGGGGGGGSLWPQLKCGWKPKGCDWSVDKIKLLLTDFDNDSATCSWNSALFVKFVIKLLMAVALLLVHCCLIFFGLTGAVKK